MLFVVSSAFHAAETSITTLYPWKVREFAKEEGETSPFKILDKVRSAAAFMSVYTGSTRPSPDAEMPIPTPTTNPPTTHPPQQNKKQKNRTSPAC